MNIRIARRWCCIIGAVVLLPAVARAGVFTDIVAGLPGVRVCSLGWADFDNDGDLDLALSGNIGGIDEISRIYVQGPGGSFGNPIELSQPVEYSSLCWGDVDNDGDLDLAICGSYDYGSGPRISRIYRNDRVNFTWLSGENIQGVNLGTMSMGDCDNDGDLDLAITGKTSDASESTFVVYLNSGAQYLASSDSLIKVNTSSLSWGDYDNDGDLDIAIIGYAPGIPASVKSQFRIYANDNGTFGSFIDMSPVVMNAGSLTWGDYDNDGYVDLAACGLGGGIRFSKIIRNVNGAQFADAGVELIGGNNGSLSWGDYDNDGKLDLAVCGSGDPDIIDTRVYRNTGASFQDSTILFPGVTEAALSFGDYDNDGDLDLALAGTSSIDNNYTADEFYARIYKSNTSGTTINTVPLIPSGCRANYDRIKDILSVRWDASTDDSTNQKGLYYEIRMATEPLNAALKKWVISPSTGAGVGSSGTQRLGTYPHGYCENATLQAGFNLKIPPENVNTTYYWQVRSIDTALSKSTWSAVQSIYCTDVVYGSAGKIGGSVTTTAGDGITGVEITARAPDGSISAPVFTSVLGEYEVMVEEPGPYVITASWSENGIRSSVFKENIPIRLVTVDFTLAVMYELAEMYGQVVLARSAAPGAPRAGAPGASASGGGFVEVSQNSRVIARVPTDDQGRYTVANLLPGRYVVRAFNGRAYSRPSVVDLREGSRLAVSFTYELLNSETVYAYPNPAAGVPSAVIHFETSVDAIEARIQLFTLAGALVKTVDTDEIDVAGRNWQYTWDLTNDAGEKVASGVYLFQVRVKDAGTGQYETVVKKLAVVR